MTALMWMLALLPQVLSAMSKRLPQPVNVTLTSKHFIHVLKWESGPGTPPGVHYHVDVCTRTGFWVPVVGCQHVQQPLVCDLSEAFTDPTQEYFTRVTAQLEAQRSPPAVNDGFRPDIQTDLDLPLLTVAACGDDLCVDLRPPVETLRNFYNTLTYKLRVESESAEKAQAFLDVTSLKNQTLKDLASGRLYCVSVRFSDTRTSRKSNFSQPVCAFTHGRVAADSWISAVLCFLVLSGVLVLVLLVYTDSTCLTRRTLPLVLTSIRHRDDFVVLPSCSLSVRSARLVPKTTLPSSGQTSDDSDEEETVTHSTGWGKGGGYKTRVGNSNLITSSSSSSSSSLAPPSSSGTKLGISTNTHSNAEQNRDCEHSLQPHTRRTQTEEEEEEEEEVLEEEEEERQDVNLLTLTLSTLKEEWVDVNSSSSSSSVLYNSNPTQTKDVAMRTVYSLSVDEEEEDEEEEEEEEDSSGYMQRPCTHVMKNFL